MIRDLVHVSAGMGPKGGGTAHLGRLISRSLRSYCSFHRIGFTGFHLPSGEAGSTTDSYRSFGGSRPRLTAAVLGRLTLAGSSTALYFDHLGPARSLAPLPRWNLPRYAIQLHGIEIWGDLSWDRRRVLEHATLLVANSAHTADRAKAYLPVRHSMRVVLLGIERVRQDGVANSEAIAAAGQGYALIVGRMENLERYKGHDELLEVWPEVRRRSPGARLVVAGSGSDLKRLREKSVQLGLADAVYFAGQVDNATLLELYRRAAVFAMPSRLEGFGLVYAEAMAAGKPCIALRRTAAEEIVVDGETGLLLEPGDSAALGSALVDLLSNSVHARTLGEAGLRRYEQEFTEEAFQSRFVPVVDELLRA